MSLQETVLDSVWKDASHLNILVLVGHVTFSSILRLPPLFKFVF